MGGEELASRDDTGEARDVGHAAMAMESLQQQPQPQLLNQSYGYHLNKRPYSSMMNSSCNSARGANLAKLDTPDEFPVGMRVLIVDDDPICLMVLEKLLIRCSYRVTKCGSATDALSLLREDIGKFDLVISDVYMPDMDGFKLLELVGLEMDLPVIMMSGNGETSAVMKGITHGACDYLLKPVRIEELRNIWQHVVRKKRQEVKVVGQTKSVEEGVGCERQKRAIGADDADNTSSATDTTDGNCKYKRRICEFRDEAEEDNEQENDDPSTMKKPRVVWSVDLHQQFVSAVNQLGIDKAVPKKILELMGVHGLTRENVASHLQMNGEVFHEKYRLYLKRLSGVTNQQGGISAHFQDSFLMSPDMGVSLANGQLIPQAMTQFHIEMGRMNSSNGMGYSCSLDPVLGQMFMQEMPRAPHLNGMLNNGGGLLSSLSNGLHRDQLSEGHHLPVVTELEDFPSSSKVFSQLNGTMDVPIGALGVANGGLGSNPSSDALLGWNMLHPRAGQQGGGSSSSLSQARGGLASHLLSSDINYAPVGLSKLGANLPPAVGLAAISGPGGGRELSPSLGGTGSSLSSPLGSLVRRPLMAEEASNLVNSTSGSFSMAPSVQSPKPGGGAGHASLNDGLEQQQAMWALYQNPLNQLSHGPSSQGLSHETLSWSGLAENLGMGDMGQYSGQSQEHGFGFAAPGQRGSYGRQSASFPVSSGLDGRMVRSSYEP